MLYEIESIVKDFDSIYSFLKDKKVLSSSTPICSKCHREMTLIKHNQEKIFRCPTHKGEKESITKKSYLENSRLKLHDFIHVIYCWGSNLTITGAIAMTGLSKSTVIQWYQYMRDICSNNLINNPYQIGGVGHVVEVDESLMCKRKYNRRRTPQERWVFGGYDREDKKGFILFVADRSSETLLPIIKKFIRPGTTIHSDCWPAYNGIAEMDVTPKYIHFTVNHSQNFVDPLTGVHTNSVECYWKNAKRKFKTMMGVHSTMVDSYLDEFLWKTVWANCIRLLDEYSETSFRMV
ncbi:uncharacterized protein LOC115210589 [Octopus sinensis]|uniref:Uncharacterized protein LOC115210589 n=1 Tax=Octopus sinensis TaxID=2607531 RepID=A0A6P7S9V7_9MOLL|nr:uncharacterized protein LOC115210589 [Octopus sinensis]